MYLVSSCLAGVNCRYNGGNNEQKAIVELVKQGKAIALCPEKLVELPTPRPCCEIMEYESGNRKVVSKNGQDFTKEFTEGAEKTLLIAKTLGIEIAILQSKSPSCGCGLIYDGTFSGVLIVGNGLTSDLLLKNNIKVYTESNFMLL